MLTLIVPILYYRIFFFCLMPIGVYILIKGIKLIRGSFNGKLISETPYSQKIANFSVEEKGIYAVWQKGPIFK